jgi:hypothetical protein
MQIHLIESLEEMFFYDYGTPRTLPFKDARLSHDIDKIHLVVGMLLY